MLIWKEKREDYSKVKLQPFVLVFSMLYLWPWFANCPTFPLYNTMQLPT